MVLRENYGTQVLQRVLPYQLTPEAEGATVRVAFENLLATFYPIWAGEGLPADIKRVQDEVERVRVGDPLGIPVVTVRRMRPGARSVLEEGGVSWADASGRAHIVVPGRLYVFRGDPIPTERPSSFSWTPAARAVAETLLTWRVRQGREDREPIGLVYEIAEIAGVSVAHTARVLRQFDELRYTVKTGAERGTSATRELTAPGRMLSEWAGDYSSALNTARAAEFHVPWREVEESYFSLLNAFAGWDWAVTSEAAADRMAQFLTSVPVLEVYVPAGQFSAMASRLGDEADVTRVESGGRIRLLPAEALVFRLSDVVRGVPMVSAPRVYADLLRHGGRSAEAAEHLREVVIGF